tara:strand:- start:323 stop:532 length:210 start_codon:yes stop_codon:yes gene_type:complete
MRKKYLENNENINISDDEYRKNLTVGKKVDINILLNRVRLENVKEKKRNIVFIISIFLSICISGYLIFN